MSGLLVRAGGCWLAVLPISLLITASTARMLFLTDLHAAIHGTFSRSLVINRRLTDAMSVVLLTLPYDPWRQLHHVRHHGRHFTTRQGDDDAIFLHDQMQIRPGLPRRRLWRNFLLSLVSPRVHLAFVGARLKVNLVACGWRRRSVVSLYLAGLTASATYVGWHTLAIAWLLPLIVLYQVSGLIAFTGEHLWFRPRAAGQGRREWFEEQTAARFVGEPYPVAGGPLTRCAWWLRLFAWHLPIRLFVLPGDLPVHDYHHHRPLGAWIDALYARQALAAPGGARLSETWGMYEPINRVLSSIAQLPAAPTYNRERTVVPIEM